MQSYKLAKSICKRLFGIQEDIERIESRYGLQGASAAAELARIFRNYIVHGEDSTPLSSGSKMVAHFYSVSRLLLMLIQLLLLHTGKIIEADIPLSLVSDDKGELPAKHVLLNLHRPETSWVDKIPNSKSHLDQ